MKFKNFRKLTLAQIGMIVVLLAGLTVSIWYVTKTETKPLRPQPQNRGDGSIPVPASKMMHELTHPTKSVFSVSLMGFPSSLGDCNAQQLYDILMKNLSPILTSKLLTCPSGISDKNQIVNNCKNLMKSMEGIVILAKAKASADPGEDISATYVEQQQWMPTPLSFITKQEAVSIINKFAETKLTIQQYSMLMFMIILMLEHNKSRASEIMIYNTNENPPDTVVIILPEFVSLLNYFFTNLVQVVEKLAISELADLKNVPLVQQGKETSDIIFFWFCRYLYRAIQNESNRTLFKYPCDNQASISFITQAREILTYEKMLYITENTSGYL